MRRWRKFKKLVRHYLYGPPNWLVGKFGSEDRRMFGFWTFMLSMAALPIFGTKVFYVSLLSNLALIPNFSSETPVEIEVTEEQDGTEEAAQSDV